MADFRRWFLALAVLALMAGAASAQVGVATGSSAGQLACTATAAGEPALRPEGYTELVGDIVISCTGGPDYALGSQVPTTNITIYIQPSVPITSRFLSSNGSSEALLIIDEAGSNIATGVAGTYGPHAPQVACTVAMETALGGSQCPAYVGSDAGVSGGPYAVSVTAPGGSTAAANVYQGQVNGNSLGVNTVTFFAVPVLPPATSGVSRTFRITNIRIPIPAQNVTGVVVANVSTSPSTVLPVTGTALNIGVVGSPMTAGIITTHGNPRVPYNTFQECIAAGNGGKTPAEVGLLTYTEGFATAFKTRVVPMSNTLWAAEGTNLGTQNIPGGLYNGFAQNSESGFIFPGITSNTSNTNTQYTAGLADFGTRLKAVFYNIPTGLTLYVSTTSQAQTATGFVAGGTSVLPYAVLVNTGSGDNTSDSGNGNGVASGSTAFGGTGSPFPITSGTATGSDGLPALPLAVSTSSSTTGPVNSAVAVWEITNANPSAQDVLQFTVYIAYAPTAPTTTNPYGTPITGLPLNAPVPDIQMNMTPDPNSGDFATTNATQGLLAPIPRFAVIKTLEASGWLTISLCQTTLLYPYVIGGGGFDTGIAVANTSMDPFGTTNQAGSCKLYPYGVIMGASGNTVNAGTNPLIGCDAVNPQSSAAPGVNCFPIVPSGQVMSVLASQALTNFQGYVIAVCNFQYAHGYAAVTDTGVRNIFSSYLALELNSNSVGSSNRGSSNGGIQGIENLVH